MSKLSAKIYLDLSKTENPIRFGLRRYLHPNYAPKQFFLFKRHFSYRIKVEHSFISSGPAREWKPDKLQIAEIAFVGDTLVEISAADKKTFTGNACQR